MAFKVFLGCSMRGGYDFVSKDELVKLFNLVEKMGLILVTKHQIDANVYKDEANLKPNQIHDRDFKWLKEADLGIFEISNPSLGVGGEISDIIKLGKPVLCLAKEGLGDEVSAYVRGKENSEFISNLFEYKVYSDINDIQNIILNFIEKIKN